MNEAELEQLAYACVEAYAEEQIIKSVFKQQVIQKTFLGNVINTCDLKEAFELLGRRYAECELKIFEAASSGLKEKDDIQRNATELFVKRAANDKEYQLKLAFDVFGEELVKRLGANGFRVYDTD